MQSICSLIQINSVASIPSFFYGYCGFNFFCLLYIFLRVLWLTQCTLNSCQFRKYIFTLEYVFDKLALILNCKKWDSTLNACQGVRGENIKFIFNDYWEVLIEILMELHAIEKLKRSHLFNIYNYEIIDIMW